MRIVSLVPSITEALCMLGLEDSIVGVTDFCTAPAPVVLAMEVPERATSVLAAMEATAVGPVAVPADYGLEPVARVHDPNLLAFLSSAHAQWSQAFPQAYPYPEKLTPPPPPCTTPST